jgi:hypothetical protein
VFGWIFQLWFSFDLLTFSFPEFQFHFFRISISLLHFSLLFNIGFFISSSSLSVFWVNSGICVLFNFSDHSYNNLKKFLEISSTSLSLVFAIELLRFRGIMLPCFSYFSCLCIRICTSEAKSLVEDFNHL